MVSCICRANSPLLPETNAKKSDPRRDTKDHEGPPSVKALPHRHRLSAPVGRRVPPRGAGAMEGGAPRELGRPGRMLLRCVPLSFPAMPHPDALPAGTAWARPRQSPAAAAGRNGRRRWPRLCQDLCGRDARAPGELQSVTSSQQGRSIGNCVYSWFLFNNHRQFLPPMIRTAGRGRNLPLKLSPSYQGPKSISGENTCELFNGQPGA